MALYLLKAVATTCIRAEWPKGQWIPSYDENHGLVVRAASEPHARRIAMEHSAASGDEHEAVWLDAKQTTCEAINEDGEPSVILVDFLAG